MIPDRCPSRSGLADADVQCVKAFGHDDAHENPDIDLFWIDVSLDELLISGDGPC